MAELTPEDLNRIEAAANRLRMKPRGLVSIEPEAVLALVAAARRERELRRVALEVAEQIERWMDYCTNFLTRPYQGYEVGIPAAEIHVFREELRAALDALREAAKERE